MSEPIRCFMPMPDGKSDERVWPRLVQEGSATARSVAAASGIELENPSWHQSSEWVTQEIDGEQMTGWLFTYATRS